MIGYKLNLYDSQRDMVTNKKYRSENFRTNFQFALRIHNTDVTRLVAICDLSVRTEAQAPAHCTPRTHCDDQPGREMSNIEIRSRSRECHQAEPGQV